jgi:hypothetical protein
MFVSSPGAIEIRGEYLGRTASSPSRVHDSGRGRPSYINHKLLVVPFGLEGAGGLTRAESGEAADRALGLRGAASAPLRSRSAQGRKRYAD